MGNRGGCLYRDVVGNGDYARPTLHGVLGAILVKEIAYVARQRDGAAGYLDRDICFIHVRAASELGLDVVLDITVGSHVHGSDLQCAERLLALSSPHRNQSWRSTPRLLAGGCR